MSMKYGICLALALNSFAQAPAPTAYSVTQVNAMMGPAITQQIYRDGSKAVVENSGAGSHSHTYYDLDSHRTYSWDTTSTTPACGVGTFSGDWGDPFAAAASAQSDLKKQNAKPLPDETVNGFASRVFGVSSPAFEAKAWIDSKSGLLVKMEMTPKGGKPQTIVDLKQYKPGHPAADLLALPASCKNVAAPPPPAPSDGSMDATMPPPSKNSCSPVFKVVRAGTNAPITSGFQVAIDTAVDLEHPASYKIGVAAGGRATFAGGSLHEVTAQLANGVYRIENAPAHWDMEVHFGNAGAASALIYRQCPGPQPVLLLVVKNPARLSDGAEWRWAKP
jgi:hypothetical protein